MGQHQNHIYAIGVSQHTGHEQEMQCLRRRRDDGNAGPGHESRQSDGGEDVGGIIHSFARRQVQSKGQERRRSRIIEPTV